MEVKKKAVLTGIAGILLAVILGAVDWFGRENEHIQRNEPGEGSLEKEYLVSAGELLEEYPLRVSVEEKQYTVQQKKKLLEKARKELDQKIVGKNQDKEHICENLVLPEVLAEGAVSVTYYFSDYEIFYMDGRIRKLPEKPMLVEISAELECQEEIQVYEFYLRAVPKSKDSKEIIKEAIGRKIKEENKKSGTVQFSLPKEAEGIKLIWKEQKESRSLSVLFLTGIAIACIFTLEKEKEKKKRKEKEQQMRTDYPEIVEKLELLLSAGMNIAMAWEKTAMTYQKKRKEQNIPFRYAYEEMIKCVYQMQEGIGEIEAYGNFGNRCGLTEYRRLSSMLAQNVRKGQKGLQRLLEEEKKDACEKRKARARTAGEEAGTKLLLPMGIMLIVVLAILMVPAGMSLKM